MKYYVLLWSLLSLLSCAHGPDVNHSALTTSAGVTTYVSHIPSRGLDHSKALERIAFGSCANQDQPAPLWRDILNTQPDLFLFMGDNVYASSPSQQPLAEQYRKLDQVPEYLALRARTPVMATWDDHDFGLRDGGGDWTGKTQALRDFRNYWQYVKNNTPFEQDGVYHATIVGPVKKRVQIILLDTRYNRSPLKERAGHEGKAFDYEPREDGTILGENQWTWLEAQLKRPAELRFIVSSIQLIADDPKFEKWGNFPRERERFFKLLESTRAKNVIILSGDRHIASIAKTKNRFGDLYEVTASSINRPNHYPDSDRHYVGPTYNKENFGLAEIDWKKHRVRIQIRGFEGEVANSVTVRFGR